MAQSTINPSETSRANRVSESGSSVLAALPGETTVVWMLWLTYGAFYFCRQNLSAAVKGLESPLAGGGLGLSAVEIGWILASLKISYGLGQLLNGQLSERIPPRVMLAVGMFGSAALNVLFGFSTGFYFLLFVWAMNGFCQSLGWTPCVRVVANWVPIERRGHAIGLIGTGYQITLGLTFLIAGWSAQLLGWRGALYVPAILLVLTGVAMLIGVREAPAGEWAPQRDTHRPTPTAPRLPLTECLYWTLYNPALWLMGLALGLLNACRYGYFDWGLKHLMDTQKNMPVGKAVLQYFVIAIGATAGAYLAGWATDRFFGSRRGPVICILMAVLGALSLIYHSAVQHSAIATMLLLVPIGFCIIGPQVLLVGTAPADLAHRGTSAAAAGFVNFMGYMGAATGDVVTGYFSGSEHGGWQRAIYIWATWAICGAAVSALLWNTTARKVSVLPGIVPKLAAIATLLLAGMASVYGQQPLALQLATFAAAGCLLAALVNRWVSLAGMIVAATGVLTVFLFYAQTGGTVAWHQATALVAYGLSLILSLMILVERKGESCA
jgi:sugar phosphate permease